MARQRVAVARCSCSDCDGDRRCKHEITAQALHNQALKSDGYNILTTIEAALSGGVILSARDGAHRDMASTHGTSRKVAESSLPWNCWRSACRVGNRGMYGYLDRPVSNSGRLISLMEELASKKDGLGGWNWREPRMPCWPNHPKP